MAAITWFLTNNIADSVHQQLEEISPGGNSTTSPNYGWTVGTTGAGNYSSADAGSEVTGFSGTIQPDGSIVTTTNQGDCWRTKQKYTGRFATGNWTFQMSVIAVTAGGAADGNAGFRLFKGKAADGSDAVEVTAGRLEGGTVTNLATSAQQDSVHNGTSITGFSCDGEYLFVQVGWEITGAALMSHDVIHRIGDTASQVISTDFTDTTTSTTAVPDDAANSGTGTAWTNLGNQKVSDNAYVLCALSVLDEQSQNLDLTDFQGIDTAIPDGSYINGVKIEIERADTGSGTTIGDFNIQLLKAGSPAGENKANTGVAWPTTDATATYGDEHDWWGTTLARADVINTGFGVRVRVINLDGNSVSARIDFVRLTVYFTPPPKAALTGTGTLAATGSLIHSASASLTGTGTLGASAAMDLAGAASLTGTGALDATGSLLVSGAASLLGTGTLDSAGSLELSASASLLGAGTLDASGTVEVGGAIVLGQASLVGTGSLAAVGTVEGPVIVPGQASLSASASINALATVTPRYGREVDEAVEYTVDVVGSVPYERNVEGDMSYYRDVAGGTTYTRDSHADPEYTREAP